MYVTPTCPQPLPASSVRIAINTLVIAEIRHARHSCRKDILFILWRGEMMSADMDIIIIMNYEWINVLAMSILFNPLMQERIHI